MQFYNITDQGRTTLYSHLTEAFKNAEGIEVTRGKKMNTTMQKAQNRQNIITKK